MSQARVVVLNETEAVFENGRTLCFQYCRYEYGQDKGEENGYRFIWKRENGNLQAARGQARIPSVSIALRLVSNAIEQGWGANIGENSSVISEVD